MRYALAVVMLAMLQASCPPKPGPSPTPSPSVEPTPTPTPSPEPTPTPETCSFTSNAVTSWRNVVKPNGGQTLDFTAIACGDIAPCNHPDPRMARCCDLSADHGNQPCADALYGAPWWTPDATLRLDALPFGQSTGGYTHKVSEGDGYITVCGSISLNTKPGACIRFHAFKAIPACDLKADGTGCVVQ
jgi:hypothetical protein